LEALEAWQKQTGSVVAILDWVMPRINGVDVCHWMNPGQEDRLCPLAHRAKW
jgi:CheY-like chemotaxis protein